MTIPDRSSTVREYYAQHPEWFTVDRHDENRRRSLPSLIAHLEAVHPSDRGKWGVLVKTDRNNKVPCDVLVWKDTGEHVDVMDSHGGIWGEHGPITVNGGDAWFWAPASVVDPTGEERALQGPPYDGQPPPGPDPEPSPAPVDLSHLEAKLDTALAEIADLKVRLQQLLDRPTPSPPAVTFPVYEGSLDLGFTRRGVRLEPKDSK